MKTYGPKLIISVVAFVALVGSVFAYALSAPGPAGHASPATAANQPSSTTQSASVSSGQTSRGLASLGEEGEGSESGEGGDDGSSNQQAPAPAIVPADVPPSSRMGSGMTGSGMMSKYKDGTYSATGSYNSPGGYDTLGVTLTLKGGIVTAATVTNGANDSYSSRYQDMFISGYKSYVIGKSIDNVRLDYVSGSSLTPIGWNDAVAQIKTKAQA